MRFNESGPDVEALPFPQSKMLAFDWHDFVSRHMAFGIPVWDVVEFRKSLRRFDKVADND